MVEQLSDAAKSLQNRLQALLRDDHEEKLEALDELCVSVSRRWRGGGSGHGVTCRIAATPSAR